MCPFHNVMVKQRIKIKDKLKGLWVYHVKTKAKKISNPTCFLD